MQTLFPKLENGRYMTPYGERFLIPREEVFITISQLCNISDLKKTNIINHIRRGILEPDKIEPDAAKIYKFNVDTAKEYVFRVWEKGRCSMHDPNDNFGYDNREIYFAFKEFFSDKPLNQNPKRIVPKDGIVSLADI